MGYLPGNKEVKTIFTFALLITIYFNTQVHDAFNAPKFWVLLLTASVLFATLWRNWQKNVNNENKILLLLAALILLYILVMVVSAINAYSVQVAFLGETFRRNGVLTYLALSIFLLSTAINARFTNLITALKFITLTGFLVGSYSIVQVLGYDWNNWSDPNSIISTLGNTNFSGAVMAFFAIAVFGQFFINTLGVMYRLTLIPIFLILLFSIYATNARQALVILALGIGVIVNLWVTLRNRVLGLVVSSIGLLIVIFSILGVLQKGPLQSFLYKDSITVRGFYWSAGFEMFKDHVLLGVGPDNYGAFFKQYREVGYPLKYGFNLTSSNAHNVYIQHLATSGIFVTLLYVLIQIVILVKAIEILRRNSYQERFLSITVIACWIGFQSQSIISIDNIGVSIWGWIFGGAIIGLSINDNDLPVKRFRTVNKSMIDLPKIFLTTFMVGLSLTLIIPLYVVDRATWLARTYFVPGDINVKNSFDVYSNRVLRSSFAVTDYKNTTLIVLNEYGERERVITELKKILSKDFRNLDSLNLLATVYEQSGDFSEAIVYRKKMSELDPWNAVNYLGLAQLYRAVGDFDQMKNYLKTIQSFASQDPISDLIEKEFKDSSN